MKLKKERNKPYRNPNAGDVEKSSTFFNSTMTTGNPMGEAYEEPRTRQRARDIIKEYTGEDTLYIDSKYLSTGKGDYLGIEKQGKLYKTRTRVRGKLDVKNYRTLERAKEELLSYLKDIDSIGEEEKW